MSLTQTNKNCIALIATKNLLDQLILTVFNLNNFVNDLTDIVIIVEEDCVDYQTESFLLKINKNIKLKIIDKSKYVNLLFGSEWRTWTYNCGYRFEIFSLTQYEKVFYIDLDVILKDNISDVFNLNIDLGFCKNHNGTIPEFKNSYAFNAGTCLINKKYLSENITTELIKISKTKKYSSDESVLFSLFGNKYTEIPSTYNTLTTFIKNKNIFNEAKIVHFIGIKKPWNGHFLKCFDNYVIRHIGINNCYFLYRKYKEYEKNSWRKIKNGNC